MSTVSPDHETKDCFIAEFLWSTQAKSVAYSSLKPIHKNWQEEIEFTFHVSKCDQFYERLKKQTHKNIVTSFTAPQ